MIVSIVSVDWSPIVDYPIKFDPLYEINNQISESIEVAWSTKMLVWVLMHYLQLY
jgi:hypothetical protein